MSSDCIKIWFSTDIHGSNACFRTFLKLFDVEKAIMRPNVMIIGGDITGKELVPIKKIGITGGYRYEYIDHDGGTKSIAQESIDEEIKFLSDGGRYPIICNKSDWIRLEGDHSFYKKKLDDERKKRVGEWIDLLKVKIKEHPEIRVYINSGNDDPKFVDEILGDFQPEGRVIKLKGNVKLLSLGYSNMTPWKCPRDVPENELKRRIDKMIDKTDKNDVLIFNFHCPPINTSLDEVYAVDDNYQRSNYKKHVGSSSIRDAIEKYKPILSLHGHIHEVHNIEELGSSMCVNPGSNYQNGILRGAYFIIDDGEVKSKTLIEDLFPKKTHNSFCDLFKRVKEVFRFYKMI